MGHRAMRLLSAVLCICILAGVLLCASGSASAASGVTLEDINGSDMFFKQSVSGTCTLTASAMLVRRSARINGNASWQNVTEQSLRPYAWVEGVGLSWNFSYAGINVAHGTFSSCSMDTLLNLLKAHPEGLVVYNANKPHAVLLTDYTNGILYCADPGIGGGRIPLESSILRTGNQASTVASFTAYWYVSSPKLTLADPHTVYDTPVELSISSSTDNKVTLSWNNTHAAGYRIYRSEDPQGPWTEPVHVNTGEASTTWTDTVPALLKPYYYCVQSYDSQQEGAFYSNVVSFTGGRNAGLSTQGSCGADVRWALYDDGVLLIAGSGDMTGFGSEAQQPWYSCRSQIRQVQIADGVTSVGQCAFSGCTALTDVTIPASVTAIGGWAFQNCGALTGVKLSAGLQSIGISAFQRCTALKEFAMPATVTTVGSWAFSECASLSKVTLSNSLSAIEDALFYGAAALTSINVPASVQYIGAHAFEGCSSLSVAAISSGVKSVGYGAFRQCTSLKSINFPSTVTTIGDWALSGCTGMTAVTLPSGLTSVGSALFYGNTALTGVTIPASVQSIGDFAFWGCKSMTAVVISNGVKNIGFAAFRGCSALRTVAVPASVTAIGDWAFSGCTALTRAELPAGLTSIGAALFYQDPALTAVTIPDSVQSIGDHAFRECSSLSSVRLPDGLQSIGYAAFRSCTSLKEAAVPAGVTKLDDWAFSACDALKTVTLPDGLSAIGVAAFYEDMALTTVRLPAALQTVSQYAFRGCTSLQNVAFPETVSSIERYAFARCYSLTELELGSASGVLELGDGAFYNCEGLTKVTLEGARLSAVSFGYCYGLADVYFPGNMAGIAGDAFASVKANMYYHDLDGSWQSIAGGSYGGKLTWQQEHENVWTVAAEPTVLTAGVLAGTCEQCGDEERIELPALNETDYDVSADGEYTVYTWKIKDLGVFTFRVAREQNINTLIEFKLTPSDSGLEFEWNYQ